MFVAKHDSAALQAALVRLERLHPKKIDLGLDRIVRVLNALGNPQDSLPPTVHVAGTNGKGSTIAFIRAIAEAQGLRVHVYTSPHLVSFRERIVLGGKLGGEIISEPVLLDALSRIETANNGEPLSFFEATTAAAFLCFNEHPADLVLLETGLGGQYDATNVVTRPAAVAITPIDYDHKEFLGTDLAGIAREKAGIFKAHTPAFSAPQKNIVRAVLHTCAAAVRCDLKNLDEDFHCYRQQGRLIFENQDQLLDLDLPPLLGDHQTINAGLAIAVAKSLRFDDKAIAKGIGAVSWPARLQPITSGTLFDMVKPFEAELWLDGGHNPHAARALAGALAELEAKSSRPLVLVMGMLANKDAPGFLDAFTGLASALVAIPIPDHTSLGAEALMDIAKTRSIQSHACADIPDALALAATLSDGEAPRILICGSLYLAGHALGL